MTDPTLPSDLHERLTTPVLHGATREVSEDEVNILSSSAEGVRLLLPYVDYLDTQAGPVELGLDVPTATSLRDALDHYLLRLVHPMRGCNTSIACVQNNGCRRCRKAPDNSGEENHS